LKSQVERSRSVPDLLLFGYKVTRMEWLQLGNILLKSGTIKLQKINGTEPLRSQPARTARPLIRAQQLARLSLQPNKKQSHSVPVHSATKQKTESLRSSLPNTEQSGSIPKIRNRATPFYLAPQPNTTLVKRRSGFSLSPRFTRSRPRASQLVAAHHGPEILLQINQIAALRPVFLSQLGRRVRHGCAGLLLRGRLRLRSPPFFHDASTPAHPLRTCATTSSSSSPRRHPPRSLPPRAGAVTCCRARTSFPIRTRRGSSGDAPVSVSPRVSRALGRARANAWPHTTDQKFYFKSTKLQCCVRSSFPSSVDAFATAAQASSSTVGSASDPLPSSTMRAHPLILFVPAPPPHPLPRRADTHRALSLPVQAPLPVAAPAPPSPSAPAAAPPAAPPRAQPQPVRTSTAAW
jgi:hypothetical protein